MSLVEEVKNLKCKLNEEKLSQYSKALDDYNKLLKSGLTKKRESLAVAYVSNLNSNY